MNETSQDPPSTGRVILFNKPFGVLSRFTDDQARPNLSDFIKVPRVYPVGRLDADSEGLLVLTDRAALVEPLLKPGSKEKQYLVCVENRLDEEALRQLRTGVNLKEGRTLPARAEATEPPPWLWDRDPPIRYRRSIPTSWLKLFLREGKNRQVRRMTAAVGHPTLRLVRLSVGPLELGSLPSGEWRDATPEEESLLFGLGIRKSAPNRAKTTRYQAKRRRRPNGKRR